MPNNFTKWLLGHQSGIAMSLGSVSIALGAIQVSLPENFDPNAFVSWEQLYDQTSLSSDEFKLVLNRSATEQLRIASVEAGYPNYWFNQDVSKLTPEAKNAAMALMGGRSAFLSASNNKIGFLFYEEPSKDPIEQHIELHALPAFSVAKVDQEMQLGKTYPATLVVDRKKGETLLNILGQTQQPIAFEQPIKTTSEIMAKLDSISLDIESQSPDWQTFAADHPAVWNWKITPRKEGVEQLRFSLFQKIEYEGDEKLMIVGQYPRAVLVKVAWPRALADFGGAVLNFVMTPLGFLATLGGAMTFILLCYQHGLSLFNKLGVVKRPSTDPYATTENIATENKMEQGSIEANLKQEETLEKQEKDITE